MPNTANFEADPAYARSMDEQDPLRDYRHEFHFPSNDKGDPKIYFCGNSLGLQPKRTESYLNDQLTKWREQAVEGHFEGDQPWFYFHQQVTPALQALTGAHEHEVVAMNTLTVNLHLMMVSFYRPTPARYKILIEDGAFPSDQYVVESQVRYHGFDPEDALIPVSPRDGEYTLRNEDLLTIIAEHRYDLALVMLPGIQFYSGQLLDMPVITQAAHEIGAYAGFDLAHAIGNVPLRLHDWDVDFATWCSYKYLNSAPGGIGGVFINERYAETDLPRFAGWWGHKAEARFAMDPKFRPEYGAEGWMLSNSEVLPLTAHNAALSIFQEAGLDQVFEKSQLLTAYLEFLLNQIPNGDEPLFTIITPQEPRQRGAQLSILVHQDPHQLFERLKANDIVVDYRKPNVIRVAPAPLYNNYQEVYHFYKVVAAHFQEKAEASLSRT